MKQGIGILAALLVLTGCTTIDFYAPEVGANWTAEPIASKGAVKSAAGLTVRSVGEEYSPVKSVGTLLAEAYEGSRKEAWSVEGPDGYKATVELIQTGLVFSGPVSSNVLTVKETDFSKAKTTVRITSGTSSEVATVSGVQSIPEITVAGVTLKLTHEGSAGGKVTNYASWGMNTGLRVSQGNQLAGYVALTGLPTLQLPPQAPVAPQAWALAIVAVQPHFAFPAPALKVTPDVIDFFGLKLTTEVSHN